MTEHVKAFTEAGCYAITYLDRHDQTYCADCVNRAIDSHQLDKDAVTPFIHWEGAPLYCENCNEDIESEYGELDEDYE